MEHLDLVLDVDHTPLGVFSGPLAAAREAPWSWPYGPDVVTAIRAKANASGRLGRIRSGALNLDRTDELSHTIHTLQYWW